MWAVQQWVKEVNTRVRVEMTLNHWGFHLPFLSYENRPKESDFLLLCTILYRKHLYGTSYVLGTVLNVF